MKKKTIAILMATMLICGGVVGATVAWLTDTTNQVVNTFTSSDVSIELTEDKPVGKTAKMVPGNTIEKDPEVTVKAGSEPCYLFVKIETENGYETFFGNFSEDQVAAGWTELEDGSNVYYRVVNPNDGAELANDASFYILNGTDEYPNGAVTVSENVTKNDMEALTGTNLPSLKFTAYAIQFANIESAAEAWDQINPSETN